MATTINLRKLLHRPVWESVFSPSNMGNLSGSTAFFLHNNVVPYMGFYYLIGTSGFWLCTREDGWTQLPNTNVSSWGAGACGVAISFGAMGGVVTQTATAGTTTTITTNRTIVKSLTGCKIRVIAGTGIGYSNTITSNTIGGNAVITVPANGVAFDNTTQFQIYSGSIWVTGSSTTSTSVYDIATNTWTARTALGGSWATDGRMEYTGGAFDEDGNPIVMQTTTATSGTSTTVVDSAKSWQTNGWANYQVRIIGGTGIGQIRTISSNTGTTLTVSAAWTVTPDATSEFVIEGNDNYIYLGGNNAIALNRYDISSNSWTVLSPGSARGAAMGAGGSLIWAKDVPTWEANANGSVNALTSSGTIVYKQDGRYLMSFRGGASNSLDVYDIAANTWISVTTTYGGAQETFSTGTSDIYYKGDIYLQKEAGGRLYKFSLDRWDLQAYSPIPYTQGNATVGNKMALLFYNDGGAVIPFLYTALHTSAGFARLMLI